MSGLRTVRVRGETLLVEDTARERAWDFWGRVERGEWEPDTFDALDRYLMPETEFVDVGAWIGPLTLYAARRCRRVHAIEPDPVARAALLRHLAANAIDNVTIDARALSDVDGMAWLLTRGALGDSQATLLSFSSAAGEAIAVPTVRFARWWAEAGVRDCALIKIDVEGGEALILPDAGAFLRALGVSVHLSLHGDAMTAAQRCEVDAALARWNTAWDGRGAILLLPIAAEEGKG